MSFLNVGIIGHVDSGKTSLAKNLSNIASTAAFDKHPQAQQRGITIDIGISKITSPEITGVSKKENHEIVVIDCPGHAGLIKAVLVAANIIDILILVVDGVKGVQTQTIECLALQEAIGKKFIIVISKIDDPLNKFEVIERGFRKRFSDISIFGISNRSGQGIDSLKQCLFGFELQKKEEQDQEVFIALIDHSFSIKGTTGIILTGTVIKGSCKVGDSINVFKQTYKLRSMQAFKMPIKECKLGDRIGFNVVPITSSTSDIKETSERSILYKEGSIIFTKRILVRGCQLSSYLLGKNLHSLIIDKMHFTIFNVTVFSSKVYLLHYADGFYKLCEEFVLGSELLVIFDNPVALLKAGPTRIIGSRLDIKNQGSRIILFGDAFDHPGPLSVIKKVDYRKFHFERWHNTDDGTLIGKGLDKFQISLFINKQIDIVTKEENIMAIKGIITGPFGSSNKFLVRVKHAVDHVGNQFPSISHLELNVIKIIKV
jgi:small GTP-binding protein